MKDIELKPLKFLLFVAIFTLMAFASLAVLNAMYLLTDGRKPDTVLVSPEQLRMSSDSVHISIPKARIEQKEPVGLFGTSEAAGILGLVIAVLGISAAFAALIPYIISKSEIRGIVSPMALEQYSRLWEQTNEQITELQKLDAHASRMIGWLLVEGTEATVWGIGWLARSAKRYFNVIHEKPSYAELLFLTIAAIVRGISTATSVNRAGFSGPERPGQIEKTTLVWLIQRKLRVNEEQEPLQPAVRACKDLIDIRERIEDAALYRYDFFNYQRLRLIERVLRCGTTVLLHVIHADSRFNGENGQQQLIDAVSINAHSENVDTYVQESLETDFIEAYRNLRSGLREAHQEMGLDR